MSMEIMNGVRKKSKIKEKKESFEVYINLLNDLKKMEECKILWV